MCGPGLISVIIPVFNVRPYLVEALESVISQTYSHLEIIVIDDGSTDGSGLICDEFAKRDERIKVIHQENRGLSNARNRGLDLMKGEAVSFLDSDDSCHPDYIKEMAEAMDREKADIVVCKYIAHDGGKPVRPGRKGEVRPQARAGMYDRAEALRELAAGRINVSVWNKLYRRRLWEDIRFPDGHNYEDNHSAFQIFDICSSVCVLDRPLYYYKKLRPGSITDTVSEANFRDVSLARRSIEEYVRDNTPAVFSFEQLNRTRQASFNGMLVSYARYCGNDSGLSSDFRKSMRAKVIEMGRELGFGSMDLRRKAAYLMLLRCPALLKIAYPPYRAVRMMIYRITGR